MKEIHLSNGAVALVDDADYDLVSKTKWSIGSHGYAHRTISLGYKTPAKQMMHRLLMNLEKGIRVDHINGNRLDNRRENLRSATHSQNLCNRGKQSNNTSGVKGVSWSRHKLKWRAVIQSECRYYHLGYFDTKDAASEAYRNAAPKMHGEFARV